MSKASPKFALRPMRERPALGDFRSEEASDHVSAAMAPDIQ